MKREDVELALREGRAFVIGRSFVFAAQIPDRTVGESGSRCTNCAGKVAYCEAACKYCKFPFIGPIGFPHWRRWRSFDMKTARIFVEDVYCHQKNRGRLESAGVPLPPLNAQEMTDLTDVLGSSGGRAEMYKRQYGDVLQFDLSDE